MGYDGAFDVRLCSERGGKRMVFLVWCWCWVAPGWAGWTRILEMDAMVTVMIPQGDRWFDTAL